MHSILLVSKKIIIKSNARRRRVTNMTLPCNKHDGAE